MNIDMEKLEAQVKARNLIAAEQNRLRPILVGIFTPLVGQPLFKKTGDLLKKYVDILSLVKPSEGIILIRCMSIYELAFQLRTSVTYNKESSEQGVVYDHSLMHIGLLEKGVLTTLIDHRKLKDDYTVQYVIDGLKKVKELENALQVAKHDLHEFRFNL